MMATFTSHNVIDELIRNDGHYEGDPDVALIVEYDTPEGQTCWGVTWVTEDPARQRRYLQATVYVNNPRIIWSRGGLALRQGAAAALDADRRHSSRSGETTGGSQKRRGRTIPDDTDHQ
jgi:hypothetical protein